VTDKTLFKDWFRVEELEPGVILVEEPWHDERVKSYLITGTERALLLDTGTGVGDLRGLVEELTQLPLTVVQSHAHWDHVGSTHQFVGDAEILIHPLAADELRAGVLNQRMRRYLAAEHLSVQFAALDLGERAVIPGVEPTGLLADGDVIDLGGRLLRVVHTPGHTAGLVTLWDADHAVLFGTDAVYAEPLYAQMSDSNLRHYLASLDVLCALDPVPRAVYSAHGPSRMDPALLPVMRDAMAMVIAGRVPDSVAGDVASHDFGEFSILVPRSPAGGKRE
jgi:glyoxylase-like metal-dependent hydrolase (beta-lactamase superfamily II)